MHSLEHQERHGQHMAERNDETMPDDLEERSIRRGHILHKGKPKKGETEKIMKYYTRLNTADGHKAVAVEGRKCTYCETAFIYKDERGIYRLVDIDTGLSICSAQKNKDLKPFYDRVKEWYELTKKKHSYQTQVHNFEMLKKATQNEEFGKETTKDA